MKKENKLLFLFFFILLLVGFLLLIFPKWTVDDAYINFRYVNNLLHGNGLVFNKDIRVEGFTSPLQIIFLTISPFNFVLTTHVLGVVSFIFGGCYLYKLFDNKIFILFYLFAPMFYTHIFSGLETTTYVALTIWCIYLFQTSSKHLIIGLILVSLCRPEGILLSILLLLFSKNKYCWLQYTIFFLTFVGLRYYYYGELVPNSFFVKANSSYNIEQNQYDIIKFAKNYLIIPGVIMTLGLLTSKKTINKKRITILIAFVVVCVSFYMKSYLCMNYSFRFWAHLYPLVLISIDSSMDIGSNKKLIPLLITQLLIYISLFGTEIYACNNYIKLSQDEYLPMGKYINKNVLPNDWVVSIIDVGVLGCYSSSNILDVGRLNDSYLAKQKPNGGKLANYIFNHNPKFITITSRSKNKLTYSNQWDSDITREGIKAIEQDKRFSNYQLVKKFYTSSRNYYQFIYGRK